MQSGLMCSPRFVACVFSGESYKGTGSATSPASDSELSAAEVELNTR